MLLGDGGNGLLLKHSSGRSKFISCWLKHSTQRHSAGGFLGPYVDLCQCMLLCRPRTIFSAYLGRDEVKITNLQIHQNINVQSSTEG